MTEMRRPTEAGRGRYAALPPDSEVYARRGITEDGLALTIWDEDGKRHRFESFRDSPGTVEVRRQWVRAVHAASGPLGTWKSVVTSRGRVDKARVFLRWAATNNIQSLDDLVDDDWTAFQDYIHETYKHVQRRTRRHVLSSVKSILVQHPNVHLRKALTRQSSEATSDLTTVDKPTREHYSIEELQQIRAAALSTVRAAWSRIEPNWRLVTTPEAEVPPDQLERWRALRYVLDNPRAKRWPKRFARVLDSCRDDGIQASATRLRGTLFLTTDEGIAAITAIIGYNGENLSTTLQRKVPNTGATAGSEIKVLTSERLKRRRGSRALMVENVTEDSDLGRILTLITKATTPARYAVRNNPALLEPRNGDQAGQRLAGPDKLILFANGVGSFISEPAGMPRSPIWMPKGLKLNFQKLHRTYITRVVQTPTDHRERTFTEAYILKDPERIQELEDIHRAAHRQAAIRVQQVALRLLTREEALGQGLDTQPTPKATRCRDIEHHPSTGRVCDRGWLACLTCPNCYILTENLPPIVALHDLLEQMERDGDDRDRFRREYLTPLTQLRAILLDAGDHAVRAARASITPDLNTQVWQRVIRERGLS